MWLWGGFTRGTQQPVPTGEVALGAWPGAGTSAQELRVLVPPQLPCVWELNVLHNGLVSQSWDKGDRDATGKGVVRATVQQPEGSGQCGLYPRPESWPGTGTIIGLQPTRLPVILCSDGSTGLREVLLALGEASRP